MRSRPFVVVIAAPSGAGKTTLARALVEGSPRLEFSISATTRPPRDIERNARDYHFVDDAGFDRMIDQGELLEWAEVHSRRYGTPRHSIEETLARGKLAVLDIDVQGARQVRQTFSDAVLIFVLPPSVEELHRRLMGRGSEALAEQQKRLRTAWEELNAAAEFDYIVVNDRFESALQAMRAILIAEEHRRHRVDDLTGHLEEMRAQLTDILKGSA